MIKKELLNMHLLPATRKMAETAERDEVKEIYGPWYRNYYGQKTRNTYRCHTYFIYLRAVVEGEVLKVSVFTRERILNGQQSLYDIYINKKEGRYLTFDNKDNKWRTAKIDMLDMGRKDAWYFLPEQRIWQTAKDRELINRYLETGNNLEGRRKRRKNRNIWSSRRNLTGRPKRSSRNRKTGKRWSTFQATKDKGCISSDLQAAIMIWWHQKQNRLNSGKMTEDTGWGITWN